MFKVVREDVAPEDAPVCFFAQRRGSIQASLDVGFAANEVVRLRSNGSLTARGMCIVGGGFVVTEAQAQAFELSEGAVTAKLVRPFVNGNDVTKKAPRKLWLIDCHGHSELEVRDRWPTVYQWILDRVKPARDQNNDPARRARWWLLGRAHLDVRRLLGAGPTYLATVMTAKHRVFVKIDGGVIPDQGLVVIGLSEDCWLSVLSSRVHRLWCRRMGGLLESRPRYNNTVCFDPYPFPVLDDARRETLCELGEALDAHRKRQQAARPGLTITGMYNVLEKLRSGDALSPKEKKIHDEGLVSVLKKIHDDLDAAVFAAYGWPATLSDEEILERLVALNHERAEEEKRGIVRWLRPEFQNRGRGETQLEIEAGESGDDDAAEGPGEDSAETVAGKGAAGLARRPGKPAARRKGQAKTAPVTKPVANLIRHPWPTGLPEQMRLVRSLLNAVSSDMTPAELAKHLEGVKPARLTRILDSLVALGHAREVKGRYSAA